MRWTLLHNKMLTRQEAERGASVSKPCVSITVFCSAIVIGVIVHCHTAGAF